MLDLAGEALQFGVVACVGEGGVDLEVIVEEALQGFGVAAAVGLVGARHEQGEVLLLGVVAGEVGMDAPGDLPEEGLEAGGWVEFFGGKLFVEGGFVGFLGALAGLLRAASGRVGVVEVDFALGDAGFEVVERDVKKTDLGEVAGFEGFELGAYLGEVRFALGEGGPESGESLPLLEEAGGVWGWLEDDFGWHAVQSSA